MTFTYDAAVEIAVLAHDGQVDKAGCPYIEHPLRVAGRFDDPVLQMIAVLHDTIEDSHLTPDDLREIGVPERVMAAVEALTHPVGEPNVVYWERVRANNDARRVKLADIADNSSPERLAVLDVDTRARLIRKYARARAILDPAVTVV